MVYLSAFLLALFVTMALVPVLRRLAGVLGAVDLPDPRKVHTQPMPRVGGLAMAAGALVPVLLWLECCPPFSWVLLGGGVVVGFGFLDDRASLGYRTKFAGQLLAVALAVGPGGVRIESLGALLPEGLVLAPWLSIPLTVVAILGVTNAINLADGLDGLAGGVAGLSFGCLALLAYGAGDHTVVLTSVAMAGAVLGFLRFNTHPATVFMGDAGSQLLGYLAITLALQLTQGGGPLSPVLPLVVLGLPVVDTLAVMAERVAAGRSPFTADKNHLHHKLMRLGLYHADAVRLIYALQWLLVAAAYGLRFHSDWLLLVGYLVFATGVVGVVQWANQRGWQVSYSPRVQLIKGYLQRQSDRGLVAAGAFQVLRWALPATILFACWVPGQVPGVYGGVAAGVAVLLAALIAVGYGPLAGASTRLALYLMTPFVLFQAQVSSSAWVSGAVNRAFNGTIAALVIFALLAVRFSRRRRFRTTPLDVLVLFVVVAVPFLAGDPKGMGMVAAKTLALFFVCEVVVAELRGEMRWMKATALTALSIVAARGLAG